MNRKSLKSRWEEPAFRREAVVEILASIAGKKLTGNDIRGISLGNRGSSDFEFVGLGGVDLTDVDGSHGSYGCSFHHSKITFCVFNKSSFISSYFKAVNAKASSFDEASFEHPTLDDAIFEKCTFLRSKWKGEKYSSSYGGRRCVFQDCDFSDASFKSLLFIAARFVNCDFSRCKFEKSTLKGCKFEGCKISIENFISCDLKSVTIDGENVDREQSGSWEDKAKRMMKKLGIETDEDKQ